MSHKAAKRDRIWIYEAIANDGVGLTFDKLRRVMDEAMGPDQTAYRCPPKQPKEQPSPPASSPAEQP